MGLFVRKLNAAGLYAMDVVQARMLSALLFMGIFMMLFSRNSFRIRLKDLWCFLGSGIVSLLLFSLCYFSGMQDLPGLAILVFYCLAGLIRLAFFNVMEMGRQQKTDENRKYYQGLPITSIAVILPLVYVSSSLYAQHFILVLHIVMLVTGLLFILNFRFRKPNNKELAVLISIVAVAVVYILIYFRWRGYMQWSWKNVMNLLRRHK